jgi:hypothetical protein
MSGGSRTYDRTAMASSKLGDDGEQLGVLRALLTGGEILPSQLPSPSNWTPEVSLAAAVFVQAMADIRLRRRDGRDHIQVASAVRWVRSNDTAWPMSFLRVCELLQLDAAWVRESVSRWLYRGTASGRHRAFRRAA